MHSPPWRWHCVRTPTAGPTCGRAKERPDSDGPLRVQGWLSVCARTHARLYRCSAFRGGGSGRPATCTATPSSSSRPARRTTRRCPSPCQGMADRMPMRIRSGRSVGVICLRVLVWGRRVPWGWPGVSAPPRNPPVPDPPWGGGAVAGVGWTPPGRGDALRRCGRSRWRRCSRRWTWTASRAAGPTPSPASSPSSPARDPTDGLHDSPHPGDPPSTGVPPPPAGAPHTARGAVRAAEGVRGRRLPLPCRPPPQPGHPSPPTPVRGGGQCRSAAGSGLGRGGYTPWIPALPPGFQMLDALTPWCNGAGGQGGGGGGRR